MLRVAKQQVLQDAFRFFWDAPDDGQVFLAHLMLGDLGRQLAGDFWAAGKDHKAADIPVQPVDTGDKIRLAARPVLGLEQIWQPAALGRFGEDPVASHSFNIGCRRVTERFFSALPPTDSELAAAGAWAGEQFGAYFEGLPVDFERAERLVAVGGTVTTLVALVHELEPYDSNFVHLRELSMEQISAAIERISTLDVAGIAALPGVQPKRAGVILAGAVVIRELMRAGGYDTLTVSENSLLAGMAATINEVLDGATPTIAWTPSLSTL